MPDIQLTQNEDGTFSVPQNVNETFTLERVDEEIAILNQNIVTYQDRITYLTSVRDAIESYEP